MIVQSSKWKFEFTSANQILEFLYIYTVEFVYNEVQGTLDLISLYASFVIREIM